MEITSYSNFRQHLKSFLSKVISSRDTLYVTQQNGEDVVVMSKSDYEGMQETLFLLSSPKNAQRLKESLEEYQQGGGTPRELLD
ncbi:type II toxin-antitoxin system Phd/YefM family antitoxin [Marinoscillum sp.]|uniref:type II toxin-antitoxin system Phd/YefM family antitoxin n=1 Tax=Marinoscillum sp. TaxID=2024838 RepID=UPI003BAB98B7